MSHNYNTPSANQSTFVIKSGKSRLSVPTKIMFSSEERVFCRSSTGIAGCQ